MILFLLLLIERIERVQGGALWSPCNNLTSAQCYYSRFDETQLSQLGTPDREAGFNGPPGQWSLSGGLLRESSRTIQYGTKNNSSPCLDSLGQVFWLNNKSIDVGELRQVKQAFVVVVSVVKIQIFHQVRFKTRVTASNGASGLIFAEKVKYNIYKQQHNFKLIIPTTYTYAEFKHVFQVLGEH